MDWKERRDREKNMSPEELVKRVWHQYDKAQKFNDQINLNDTIETNENFFIGKQWEGVRANGLPTPVFNVLQRIGLYQIASICSDNIKVNASPVDVVSYKRETKQFIETYCQVLNAQFESIWERARVSQKFRTMMKDSFVRGDGCLYSWFDADAGRQGEIKVEVLENNRVYFGNPQNREVQEQPWIIIEKREQVCSVCEMCEDNGTDPDAIRPDKDNNNDRFDNMTDDKVTVLTRFRRDRETGTIFCMVSTHDAIVREEWDTKQKLYPISWMSWNKVTNCYHGMSAVTGLIPNQVFINKMFAMVYLSLMTTAYPKIVYDKTRIRKWDSSVGVAIGVNGGDINGVAKNLDGATISPQVGEFITLTINTTKDMMGATDAAMGNTRPDNTSAIVALQKASSVPMEMVKQDSYQCVEDTAYIWVDLMRCNYGKREVEVDWPANDNHLIPNPDSMAVNTTEFDFGMLDEHPCNIKLDVGGSSYWSEIQQIQTLDNLLINGKISTEDYIERLPTGYIQRQDQLLEKMKQQAAMAQQMQAMAQQAAPAPEEKSGSLLNDASKPTPEVVGGSGYNATARNLNRELTRDRSFQ